MPIEATLIPKLTRMAISVEMLSITAMKKGPRSLQIRSMRLIWEFIAGYGRQYQLEIAGLRTRLTCEGFLIILTDSHHLGGALANPPTKRASLSLSSVNSFTYPVSLDRNDIHDGSQLLHASQPRHHRERNHHHRPRLRSQPPTLERKQNPTRCSDSNTLENDRQPHDLQSVSDVDVVAQG